MGPGRAPGATLVVPHLNFAFLDEAGSRGDWVRERVLKSCESLVRRSQAFVAFGEASPGMQREAAVARTCGIPVLGVPGWDP